MTDYKATPEQWQTDAARWLDAIVELRARVELLEVAAHKHIVETNSNIVALFTRVEALEVTQRQPSKVYEISKPLKLTSKQQEDLKALLQPVTSQPSPNSSQIGNSLVERVRNVIASEYDPKDYCWDEARAAIREVTAWMRENQVGYSAVRWIEQEIDQ